ncbi:MAG: flagellar export chaperone FliS [Acidaminococcales bacterium]|jgi:flagellar protein FliS|nr:flagellar export chaperone FliS [Acidaminococcales bacterium]
MTPESAKVYKQQQILTATPEKLILMLYNGCLKFMNSAAAAIGDKDIQAAHNACVKAQDIVSELMSVLNMDYPISKDLYRLYEYANHQLLQANLKKDAQYIANAKVVITNIRDGWIDAMKIAREQGSKGPTPPSQKVVGDSISV